MPDILAAGSNINSPDEAVFAKRKAVHVLVKNSGKGLEAYTLVERVNEQQSAMKAGVVTLTSRLETVPLTHLQNTALRVKVR